MHGLGQSERTKPARGIQASERAAETIVSRIRTQTPSGSEFCHNSFLKNFEATLCFKQILQRQRQTVTRVLTEPRSCKSIVQISQGEPMRRTMLLAMTALVPGVFLMQTVGSSSVAVVDVDRAVAESAGKDAITKLNAFAADQKVAIDKEAKEAQDLENRLRVQDRALSTAARDQLTKSLEDAQAAVEKLSTEAQDKYDKMQQEVLGPAQQKTIAAINTYAAEHSVKIVLDASVLRNGLVYVNDTADITSEIIRRIAANLENPNQKNAADRVGQLAHRQWLPIPSFANELKQSDRLVVGRDVERNSR